MQGQPLAAVPSSQQRAVRPHTEFPHTHCVGPTRYDCGGPPQFNAVIGITPRHIVKTRGSRTACLPPRARHVCEVHITTRGPPCDTRCLLSLQRYYLCLALALLFAEATLGHPSLVGKGGAASALGGRSLVAPSGVRAARLVRAALIAQRTAALRADQRWAAAPASKRWLLDRAIRPARGRLDAHCKTKALPCAATTQISRREDKC
jgi:hypothetical protein